MGNHSVSSDYLVDSAHSVFLGDDATIAGSAGLYLDVQDLVKWDALRRVLWPQILG